MIHISLFDPSSSEEEEYNPVTTVQQTYTQSGHPPCVQSNNQILSISANETPIQEGNSQLLILPNKENMKEQKQQQQQSMSNHGAHQQEEEEQQQHTSQQAAYSTINTTNTTTTCESRRVSIIDETDRTKEKISKRRKKKSTRLRKPLQNDDLLKNYFEMDQLSSTELTTFKIVQQQVALDSSNIIDQQSLQHEKKTPLSTTTPNASLESFITKSKLLISSKLSESEESSSTTTTTTTTTTTATETTNPTACQLFSTPPSSTVPTVLSNPPPSSFYSVQQQLLNRAMMNSYSVSDSNTLQQSNTFMNTQRDNEDETNQLVSNMENDDNILNRSNENDNFSFLSDIDNNQDFNNVDLLQLLMQLTNTNNENSSLERNEEK